MIRHQLSHTTAPLCGLLFTLPLLVLAQDIVPSRQMPGDAAIAAAAGDQQAPQIARGGNQFLVVWQDSRAIVAGDTGTGIDIYAMRLDAAGNPIDALPIPITRGPADQTGPRLSWNGQNWLVAWDTNVTGPTGYYTQGIQAARVSPAGVVLDTTPIAVSNGSLAAIWALASDGVNWTIIYQGSDRGNDIWGTRISAAGQILDNPAVLILPATYFLRFTFALAYSDGNYLFTWADSSDIQGLFLTATLQPLTGSWIRVAPNSGGQPSLAGNGSGFFFLWLQQQPSGISSVMGSRITAAGVVQDPSGINISLNNQPAPYSSAPQVSWSGAAWLVDWSVNTSLAVARVTTDGVVLDPGGRQIANIPSGPVALGPTRIIELVYTDGLYSNLQPYDVKGVAISNTLVAGPPKPLSTGAPAQAYPDIAAGTGHWMSVWRSATSSENRILAQPLDALGLPAAAAPIVLESAARLNGPDVPAIAWNGTYYLAVWSNPARGGVFGMRLLPDGTKVDASPFLIVAGYSPDVAALGDDFLIVSIIPSTIDPHFQYPYGVRVDGSTGQVLDTSPILLGTSFAVSPAVAAFADRWVFVYQANISHDNPRGSILGGFVSPAGVPQGSFNVATLLTPASRGPQVAVNGAKTQALISYEDETISTQESDILFRRISSTGTFLDPAGVPVTAVPGNQTRTASAWNGREYVVAWQDQRNRTSILDILDSRTDIFAARISESGVIQDPNGFLVAATPGGEVTPIAAGAANGETILGAIVPFGPPFDAHRLAYTFHPGGNRWPIVSASAAPPSGDIPLNITFSAAGSSDPDGSLVSYAWDFGDGTTGSGPAPVHSYTEAADYVATLTVTDNAGASSSTAILVRATVVNQAPVAIATANKLSGPAPLDVILNADASFDPDGQIAQFQWTFSDGASYYGSIAYHTFSNPGTATATLTITDDRGATAGATLNFNIGPLNIPPIASASGSPTLGKAPLTVQFSSAGSSDPDGTITAYLWDFGDGTTSALANPSHVYTTVGTYYSHLTVTDNAGVSTTTQSPLAITVQPALTPLKCIGITMSGRPQSGGFRITGNAVFTDGSNLALAGVTVTGEWTLPDGGKSTQTVQTKRNGSAVFSTSGSAGTYILRILDAVKTGYQFDKANSVLSGRITR